MQETTPEDRQKELHALLEQMRAHPEQDWTEEKRRVAVLREMLNQPE